jgi:hypothetical protein
MLQVANTGMNSYTSVPIELVPPFEMVDNSSSPFTHGMRVWFTDIVGGSVYRHRMTPVLAT